MNTSKALNIVGLRGILVILIALVSLPAWAEVQYKSHVLKFAGQVGITDGGDELSEAQVDGWGGDYTDTVDAGGGVMFTLGALMILRDQPIDIQFNVGVHYDGIYGSDDHDEIDFGRGVFESVFYYRKQAHRLGLGMAYHTSPEFEFDVDGVYFYEKYENELAFITEYRYVFKDQFSLGLRYVSVDYDSKFYDRTIDGNHVGLVFGIFL